MEDLTPVSYAFRPIPVQSGKRRLHVHLPKHVLFLTPSGRIEPANTAGFNRNPYHLRALLKIADEEQAVEKQAAEEQEKAVLPGTEAPEQSGLLV